MPLCRVRRPAEPRSCPSRFRPTHQHGGRDVARGVEGIADEASHVAAVAGALPYRRAATAGEFFAQGDAARPGPPSHVLDWFHLAMRIQHAAPTAKGWPDDTPAEARDAAGLADAADRVRWRLWHGQVQRALDLVGDALPDLDSMTLSAVPAAAAAGTLAPSLRGLETCVPGQNDLILDDATARRSDEPSSTAATESTVPWLLHRRLAFAAAVIPASALARPPRRGGLTSLRRAARLVRSAWFSAENRGVAEL